jgi:hypothetical protein
MCILEKESLILRSRIAAGVTKKKRRSSVRMERNLSRRCQIQLIVTLYKTALIAMYIILLMDAYKSHLPKFLKTMT